MRTGALLTTLILMLTWAVSSGGCQLVSGLTVLEVTGGSGGEGGGGGGGSGGGAECTKASECGVATECISFTCDSAGKCQHEDAASGTACGPGCGDGVAISAGTCDGAGQCDGQTTNCPMNYGCNPVTKACTDVCKAFSDCSSTGFCVTPVGKCESCGIYPPMPPPCMPGSGSCETCSGDVCVKTCDAVGECNGSNRTLDAGMRPARLVCNGQCNNITVICQGPHPCEVVCDSNGCNGLTMKCSSDGPCKLTCLDTACEGKGATMLCSENECSASCAGNPSAMIAQTCGGSCGCSKTGCQ